MYKIIKDGTEYIQSDINNVVIDPELKEKINGVPSLVFSIPFNDKYYNEYIELKTIVSVYRENDLQPEFVGRLLSKSKSFDGDLKLEFEGEMAYLNDIMYPSYDFSGSPEELFESVLDYYNANCSKDRQILKGSVTVTDANDYITRSNQDYSSCWKVISEKLVNSLGGYLKLRYVNDQRYLDYLVESGNESNQNIKFGENLLDITDYIDATDIGTVIIPLGAKDEATGERITISSVNDGLKYLESSLISVYGRIEKIVTWDDVTLPVNLKTKAQKYLEEMILAENTITVKAVDLHFTDETIDSFKIGNIINCISEPHDLNIKMMLVERTRKLNNPVNDTITLGSEQKTISSSIGNTQSKVEENENKLTGNWLQTIIDENNEALFGKTGGNVYVQHNESTGYPEAIYIMDSPSISEAKNVIVFNSNGIGQSTNGIEGPFNSAWTIDGRFNTELIQANSINVNQLASNVGEELDLSSNKSISLIVSDINNSISKITDQITCEIESSEGFYLNSRTTSTLMTAKLYKNNEEIDVDGNLYTYNWYCVHDDSADEELLGTGKTIILEKHFIEKADIYFTANEVTS